MRQEETVEALFVGVDGTHDSVPSSIWDLTQPVHINRFWSGHAAPLANQAEARLAWTNDALLVRFVGHQRHPLVVSSNPRLDEKTLGLWERDVCEIFIAPFAEEPTRYFEFEAAPTGEWVDLAVCFKAKERVNDFDFVSGMTVTTNVQPDQIEIIMSIPWSTSIPRPKKGDEWRVNLFRCVGIGNERYLAWRPTFSLEPNFHVPEAFGILRFI